MAKKFRDVIASRLPPERQARAAAQTKAMLADLRLFELRRARSLSQEELAQRLHATQPEISKLERRTDMYISTLRKYVAAMGGELEILARFATGTVRLNQFSELAREGNQEPPAATSELQTPSRLSVVRERESESAATPSATPARASKRRSSRK